MANPSMNKRLKERQRQEKQREKLSQRKDRAVEKSNKPPGEAGVDNDIAHIIPGPQPIAEEDTGGGPDFSET